MIQELDRVILTKDIPGTLLKSGDVGVVVMTHENPMGFEVEFVALNGETVAIETLLPSEIRAIEALDVPNARTLSYQI